MITFEDIKKAVNSRKYKKYIIIATSVLCACIIRNVSKTVYNKLKSYPNGMHGLPLFGCLFHFGINPRAFLLYIAKQYGPITYVPLMASNNLFISDPEILKKLYRNEKILDRPPFTINDHHLVFLNGKAWEKRRKYAMETVLTLSNSSFVLNNIKQCIDNHIEPIINETCVNRKELWYPEHSAYYLAFNNVFSSAFGEILPFNDPFISTYCKSAVASTNSIAMGIFFDLTTNFSNIWPDFLKWQISGKNEKFADDILIQWMRDNGFIVDLDKKILTRQNDTTSSNTSMVYIDRLIQAINHKQMTINQAFRDLMAILAAGTDTTSTALEYGFLLLAKSPIIQEKVYQEIMRVMEKNNLKEFSFKIINELHIFRAFIHEMLRISCVGPTGGVPHITTKDHRLEINGDIVIIPKHTVLHSNVYYMLKCMNWEDNKPFINGAENNDIHLDYWLDSETNKFKMNDNFILFGVGRRDCIGQSLAMRAIYATFGLMIVRYKFIAPNNDHKQMQIKQSCDIILSVYPKIGINVQKREEKHY